MVLRLNCTANGRLRGLIGDRGMFVNGAAHDGGTALGAALAIAAECGELRQPRSSNGLFLGPCFTIDTSLLNARRLGLIVDSSETDVARKVSTLLSPRTRLAAGFVAAANTARERLVGGPSSPEPIPQQSGTG